MADNVDFQSATPATPAAGTKVSTEEVTTLNGATVTAQQVQRVGLALRTADATAIDLPGDDVNGLDIDVTRLPALPTGTNNIGDVDVLTLPELPAGDNNIGNVDVLTLPALPIGTNNIGDVDVLTLPALPAGTNNIGDVDVLTLPAGTVAGSASLPAGTNNIGDVDVLTLPALPAGNNNIGDVDIASSVLPTGAATETTLGTRLSESDFDTKTGALTETAPVSDTASSGLNGRLQRVAQRVTSLIALLPTSLGTKTAANSLSITTSNDDALVTLSGAVNETAPATDIASSGLNGRLQRIAQRLTSLIALFPTSLGTKTAANSLSVTTSSDDALVTLTGAVTEAAPANDTASSGLNGRLQRIAQRLTSLIALVPAALTGSGNFKVAVQEALPTGANVIGAVNLNTTLSENNDSVTGHIGGYSKLATLTMTRPSNTTLYAASDEIADNAGTAAQRTFACARVNNGTGTITGAFISYSNNPAVTPVLELYLFDADPTSAGDNAAFAPSDSAVATCIGTITFPSPKVGITGTSGNLMYDSGPLSIEFQATGGTTSIFGLLVTRVGFQPIAVSEVLTIRLRVQQN